MKRYKFIGGPDGDLINLCSSVSLKCKKSDNTLLIINDIIPNDTIIEVNDSKVITYLDLDSKYEEVI